MAFLYNIMEMIGGTILFIVQLPCLIWLFTTLWTAASHDSLSLTISRSLLKHVFRLPSNHLILCRPLLLPSVFASIRVFPSELSFVSGGQSIGASAPTTVLLVCIWGWFPLRLTGLISLLSKRLSTVFSNTTVQKHQFFGTLPSLWSRSDNCMWLLRKP